MNKARRVWLVFNEASGSNNDVALTELREALEVAGLEVVRETCFPTTTSPTRSELEGAQTDTLAVFAGDGTISSVVSKVAGWGGAVLPLPGGTMNMLSRRLHGDASGPEIIARFSYGIVDRVRPTVLISRHAVGLTGALAGPGTVWNDVREAMRELNLKELVTSATEAIAWSANGPRVICPGVESGREEGYAAITLTPQDDGIEGSGYYAATIGDYARHGVALLQHDFRNGPHDPLGRHAQIRLACPNGEPMGLLIDGEPFDGGAVEDFRLGKSEIDFWMTADAR
ncbi:diacylglycerol kinase family protein [Novosphingobium sp. M1R2S20]|uniref:Diacylglycerol kinase family protein n=1 Tax=Novosphingobium rhizovicinum TaxID=3228928 RepID=A0ABV3RBW8_9SPHN